MAYDGLCEKFLAKVGHRIRLERERRQWTLEEAEQHGELSWRHLQKIEAGKNITLATLWKVAQLYQIEPGALLSKK